MPRFLGPPCLSFGYHFLHTQAVRVGCRLVLLNLGLSPAGHPGLEIKQPGAADPRHPATRQDSKPPGRASVGRGSARWGSGAQHICWGFPGLIPRAASQQEGLVLESAQLSPRPLPLSSGGPCTQPPRPPHPAVRMLVPRKPLSAPAQGVCRAFKTQPAV